MESRLQAARRWRIPFLCLFGLAILTSLLSFSRKVSTFGRADILVTFTSNQVRIEALGESASSSGLLAGDIILAAGSQPVQNIQKFLSALASESLELQVLRGQRLILLKTVPSPAPWNIRYLFLCGVAAVLVFAAAFSVWGAGQTPQPEAHYIFSVFAFSLAIVLLVSPAPPLDSLFRVTTILEDAARAFFPASLLALVLVFPRPASGRRLTIIFGAALVLSGLAALTYFLPVDTPEEAAARLELLDRSLGFWIVLACLAALLRLLVLIKRKTDLLTEKQVRFLLFGTAAGLLPVVLLGILPSIFGIRLPILSTLSVIPLALIPLSFLAAITRYRIWDVDILARETAAFITAAFLGASFFAAIQYWQPFPAQTAIPYARGFIEALAGLLVALSMLPVRRGLSSALARVQYGETYSSRDLLRALSRELLVPRRAHEIAHMLRERVSEGLGVRPVVLLAVQNGTLDSTSIDGGHPLPLSELPSQALAQITRLSRQEFSSLPTAAVARLRRAGFRTLAPLAVSGKLLAVLAVGDRPGQGPLTSEDIELLGEVLAPAALALDHARLYQELEEEVQRYKTLKEFHEDVVEGSAAAIAVTDENGFLTSVNPAFCALLCAEEEALIGASAHAVLPVDLIRTEGSTRMTVPLGTREVTLDVAVSPFPGASGASRAKVYVLHDVTETVRLEKALAEKERLAALSTLSAGVAHEVNTPLTGVASFARLVLDDTPESDPRRPLLEKIEEQAFKASRLISSLLDLARGKPRDLAPQDPRRLLQEAVDSVKEEVASRRVRLTVRIPDTCPLISGHGDALIQVLINLVKNAVEAVSIRRGDATAGTVVASIRAAGANVYFEVEDNGPGLNEEQREKVFTPFYSTKTAQGGVGLGLAIASDIIRAHGGTISVEPLTPHGSRFAVSLPALT